MRLTEILPNETAPPTLVFPVPDAAKSRNGEAAIAPNFAEVVRQHWTAVYRMLHCLTGNEHDTEDLTQETFLRALDKLDTFQPGTQMRNWLLRIASNAYFDVHRKRRRVKLASLADDPPGPERQPDHRLETAEQSEILKAAVEELPETTRLVFHLRATEDLSFREIAELANTTEQAARWHMHHARTRLLEKMGVTT